MPEPKDFEAWNETETAEFFDWYEREILITKQRPRITADEWNYLLGLLRTHPAYTAEQMDIEHLIGELQGALGLETECPICGIKEPHVCRESL